MFYGFLEELDNFDVVVVNEVIEEVKVEMFELEKIGVEVIEYMGFVDYFESKIIMMFKGNVICDFKYYLDMLVELVDVLDDVIL